MLNPMEDEDEFGDLYADIIVENSGFNSSNPPVPLASKPIYQDFNEGNDDDDDNDEEVLYGKPSSPSCGNPSSSPYGKPSSSPVSSQQQQQQQEVSSSSQPNRREEKEIARDEVEEEVGEFHFGGVEQDDGNEQDVATVKPEMESDYLQGGEIGDHPQGSFPDDFLATEKKDELDAENSENQAQEQAIDRGDQDSACENNMIQLSMEVDVSPQVNDNSYIPGIDNSSIPGIGLASGAANSLPGISTGFPGYHEDGGVVDGDDFGEKGSERQQELRPSGEMVGTPNQDLQEGEEWDSDSDDDLQIVLNDDRAMYQNLERGDRDFEEGSEDEDGDDLVIVADGEPPLEEQEWGADTQLPLEGVASTSGDKVLGADKAGDDRGQIGKGNIAIGNGALSRVGYSGHNFHSHYSQYSQFKYVRPGATAIAGGIPSVSAGAPIRPSVSGAGIWGPGKGVPSTGKGDWMAGAGRGSLQRTSLGSVMPPWGNAPGGRGYLNGFEFTLPPNKFIFEIDIDSFEEKPWKQTGMDITDFFNFNLDDDGWKQYCKQLEQLRLEATMQSKIRVYESGRSEQEYDPDLPPELAAAAGLPEAYGENTQNKPSDGGSSIVARGRGSGRGRVLIPTGRAIQVEGGGFERRPSADFRRPRFHDSDAVIEIVLQDASTDDAADPCRAPESGNDVNEKEDSEKGEQEFVGDEKQVNTDYFLQSQHAESWERDIDDRKNSSGGVLAHRSLHHGDGILPLPPGPPIHCQPGSGVGPPMFSASILDQQHVNRRMRMMKPKGFPQQGHEQDNGIVANQGVRGSRADSWHKGRIGNGVERGWTPEVGHTRDDIDRKPTSEVRCIDLEQHAMEDVTVDSRSDGQSKPNSEVKGEEDTTDDHGSVYSMKGLKMNSHGSPIPVGGYAHRFKESKSGNSKAESGNSRGYSKDRGNSRDYTKGRGSGEDEIMQYRPQKRLARDVNNHQFDEDSYHYQDYPLNSRHNDEKDNRHQKSRDYLNHHGDDLYLHGDRGEEVYTRRIKDERSDRHRERDEHIKPWQGKNEDLRSLREKDDELWRIPKDGSLQNRDRRQNTERDERKQHLHPRKRKDEDDLRAQLDREVAKRREKEDAVAVTGRLEKVDDPCVRRKKDEDLRWKEKVEKDETSRDIREREDIGGEKHDKADDYRRRKEEDLRRRERFDRDQSVRDLRDREDVGREKNGRDGEYLRRKDEDTKKKERSDKDQVTREIRDRDDIHREKHERDDEHLRRKEEELHRRERADKDEGLRDPREREDVTKEKPERDDDHHYRRREDDSRRRNMFDDSRSRKQRDDSWRRKEKEDEILRKPGFDETHGRREREEDKSSLAGRSRRHSEEKLWHGSDRERGRSREEASLSSIDKDRLKEKRRFEEPRAKVKDRVDETGRSRHHERDEMYSRIDRTSRLDRPHLRYDHSVSGHSVEDQKLYREKRTLDHRNGLASGLVDDRVRQDQTGSKRRKTEDHYNHEKRALDRGAEDPESGGAWIGHSDRRAHSRMISSDLPKRMHEQEGSDHNNSKLKQPADDSVSEDEHGKRGRSKLERWMSHKEREDARAWENDARKRQKLSSNHEEPTIRNEENKMESSSCPETNQKPGNDCLQSQEGGEHIAEREQKDAVSDKPVHIAEGVQAETDKGESQQHSEVVAKLEKRRERFKQPIQNDKDSQKKSENEIALENELDEVKHERPARKRRWGSN